MKKFPLVIGLGIVVASTLNPLLAFGNNSAPVSVLTVQGRSSIYGIVFGEARRPVADVYVELLDDVNSTIRQIKTDMSGRFQFNGLVDGRYIIKVRPGNTGYLEHTQQVVISAVSSVRPSEGARFGGADNQHLDIVLALDQRFALGPFAGAPAVVFAQDVPQAAKTHYDEGIAFLRDKKEEQGFRSLKLALEVFPDYYAALDRLGGEYAIRGEPGRATNNATANSNAASTTDASTSNPSSGTTREEYLTAGLLLLTKATQINPRGYSSMFGLGWTQYQLGRFTEAIETLGKAAAIYNKSGTALLWQGKAYRRTKMLDKAEETLKKADQLTTGKDPDIHMQLAALYNDQKRYAEAADQMELYLKYAPKGEDPQKIKDLIKRLRDKAK